MVVAGTASRGGGGAAVDPGATCDRPVAGARSRSACGPQAERRPRPDRARHVAAFTFFDTYMDVLTQRRSPELGPVLAGCDVLAGMRWPGASDATRRPPLVFCDRGFGASIVRESVPFPDGTPNPMPLIQIPYSRLKRSAI